MLWATSSMYKNGAENKNASIIIAEKLLFIIILLFIIMFYAAGSIRPGPAPQRIATCVWLQLVFLFVCFLFYYYFIFASFCLFFAFCIVWSVRFLGFMIIFFLLFLLNSCRNERTELYLKNGWWIYVNFLMAKTKTSKRNEWTAKLVCDIVFTWLRHRRRRLRHFSVSLRYLHVIFCFVFVV